ncbi:MAG: class D beta-lactamase [Hyphomicrobium sp.]|nr:MAG: class D beta-lactamase [Hyphomicrobium sp.]
MTSRSDSLTRRKLLQAAAAVTATGALPLYAAGTRPDTSAELETELKRQGVVGTFAHLDLKTDRLTMAHAARAGERMIPASTFKIANSLIAIETGVVADEREVFRWNGQPRSFKAWEQDMTLRQAIPASNVPVFQQIARRVGLNQYREWLDKLEYGNGLVGDAVETFWLDGPLKISAVEQTSFLAALALGQLPISKRSQDLVKDMLRVETRTGRTLYAKSGWCFSTQPQIGWWVGWVEAPDRVDTFALNMDMTRAEDAPRRITAAKSMLAALNVY